MNWDIQQKIWDRIIGKDVFDVTPSDTKLVLTDPIYNVPAIKDFSYEILFEHHSFHSVAKTSGLFHYNLKKFLTRLLARN